MTGTSTYSSVWNPEVSNGRGASLQIGEAGGFSAFFAIRFDLTDALPDSHIVENKQIRFIVSRVWPEEDAPDLVVRIREITDDWDEDELLEGIFADRESFPAVDSLLFISEVDDTLRFEIPDDLWERWAALDTANYGLLFERIEGDVLISLFSSEGGTDVRAILEVTGTQWSFQDSVWEESDMSLQILPEHDGYLASEFAEPEPGRLYLCQGFPQRAAIYFPVDTVSEVFSRIVNRAELRFYADLDHPANLLYEDVGLLYKDGSLLDTSWIAEPDSAVARYIATSSTVFDSTNTILAFGVGGIVSGWVEDPATNGGFQVKISSEDDYLARQVFHGADSEELDKRPQLIIWYTENTY